MLHTKFRGNRPAGSGEKDCKGFYHIGAWRPSWSCDQHHVIRFSLTESFHVVWFWSAQLIRFLRVFTI